MTLIFQPQAQTQTTFGNFQGTFQFFIPKDTCVFFTPPIPPPLSSPPSLPLLLFSFFSPWVDFTNVLRAVFSAQIVKAQKDTNDLTVF